MRNPAHDQETAVAAASQYLESAGYRILDHTWQNPRGCLDIVAADRQVLVVCQVKTRLRTGHGTPTEAVSQASCGGCAGWRWPG